MKTESFTANPKKTPENPLDNFQIDPELLRQILEQIPIPEVDLDVVNWIESNKNREDLPFPAKGNDYLH